MAPPHTCEKRNESASSRTAPDVPGKFPKKRAGIRKAPAAQPFKVVKTQQTQNNKKASRRVLDRDIMNKINFPMFRQAWELRSRNCRRRIQAMIDAHTIERDDGKTLLKWFSKLEKHESQAEEGSLVPGVRKVLAEFTIEMGNDLQWIRSHLHEWGSWGKVLEAWWVQHYNVQEVENEVPEPVREEKVMGRPSTPRFVTVPMTDGGERVNHRFLASTPVILLMRNKKATYERRVSANVAAWAVERGVRGAESLEVKLDTQGRESHSTVASQEQETAAEDDGGVVLETESRYPRAGAETGGDGDRFGQRDGEGYGSVLAAEPRSPVDDDVEG